jgi:TonB family protein
MVQLQKKIKSHWQIKNDTSESSQVTFKVDSHGDLSALKLTKSSGSAKVDESGLQAVRDAAPFSPLPIGSPDQVDIQFSFDYNVFAKGDVPTWKKKVASLQNTGGLELAKALVSLGGCYEDAEDYKHAANSYDQAIAIFESRSGTTYSGDLFDALNDAGTVYQTDLNDFPQSEKLFRKALNLIKRQSNPDQDSLASAQQHLGEALSQQLKTDEAVPLLKTALNYRSRHRDTKEGKDSYTDAKQSLADAYWGGSQVDQAFPLYQDVLKETETQDGADVTDVIRPLCDVADCLHAEDEDNKALPLYNKAIKLAKDLKFQDSNGIVADAEKTVAEIKNGGSEQSDSSSETQTSTATGTASTPTRKPEVDSDARAVAQQVDPWVYPLLGGSILILTLVAFLTRKKN